MCGIVALISPAVACDADVLSAMRDRLAHRGPDGAGIWISPDQRVGLAHRRLAIIDRSENGHQPMVFDQNGCVIVFNGEIYNYIELRETLKKLGYVFKTQSDTEVLLASYAQWDTECLQRLNGMFAFCIWDERQQRVFAARDRFGEKPMYLGRGANGTVAIASEMKAILIHPAFQCSPDAEAVKKFACGAWYEDDAKTFFEGVERVPPAHALCLAGDGSLLKRWRYWVPNCDDTDEAVREGDAIERFAELLAQSVRLRLRADVPIGSSLSGGLDSSAIVGLVARQRRSALPQNTFSAMFEDDPTISEHKFIDLAVSFNQVESFRVSPDPLQLAKECGKLHWHQEEPFLSASIYLQWCVARLAKERGTTVLLDGQGADELLGGYQFWFKAHQLDLMDRGAMMTALWETFLFNRRLDVAARAYPESQRRFNAKTAYTVTEVLKLRKCRPDVWHYAYSEGLVAPVPGKRFRRIAGEALLYNSLPMLLRYADRNAMAFSREGRLPFLDYELVDFCLRLPDRLLLRHGWQKWVLRKATATVVPDAIRWRADKVGYAAPLDRWLRGPLKAWGRERLESAGLRDIDGYDPVAVRDLWNSHQTGGANNSWAIWRWISLAEWLETVEQGWWSGSTRPTMTA